MKTKENHLGPSPNVSRSRFRPATTSRRFRGAAWTIYEMPRTPPGAAVNEGTQRVFVMAVTYASSRDRNIVHLPLRVIDTHKPIQ